MKIFIIAAKENWITDQLYNEFVSSNKLLVTNNIYESDIIWILSNYMVYQINNKLLTSKKVITTIHHIVPWKMNEERIKHYKYLDSITNVFHSICDITTQELRKYTQKKIIKKPFWINQNLWREISFNAPYLGRYYNKELLRLKYNIPINCFLIGSFQRDTEGNSITNKKFEPKLEKGPDIFVKIINKLKNNKNSHINSNIRVLLTGKNRQYMMIELEKINVKYTYFEMVSLQQVNELYNCLDLYIVSSRVEGSPQAIKECAITKVPIISTNVGIASEILHKNSIYDMNTLEHLDKVITNSLKKESIKQAYKNIIKYNIPLYFAEFVKLFREI